MGIITKAEKNEPSFFTTLLTGGLSEIASDLSGGRGYTGTAINTDTGQSAEAWGSTIEEAKFNAAEKVAK